jgi:hypothetical protein
VVGAEESGRTGSRAAASDARKNCGWTSETIVANIGIQQFCKNVYVKLRAFVLG